MIHCVVVKFEKKIVEYGLDILLVLFKNGIAVKADGISISENGNLLYWDGRAMQRYSGNLSSDIALLIPEGVFDAIDGLQELGRLDIDDSEKVNWYGVAVDMKKVIEMFELSKLTEDESKSIRYSRKW